MLRGDARHIYLETFIQIKVQLEVLNLFVLRQIFYGLFGGPYLFVIAAVSSTALSSAGSATI